MEHSKPGADLKAATQRKGSFGQTARAVAWSFFGVRKSSDFEKDASQINPIHVVIAGLVAAAIFVIGLILLVRMVVSNGLAQ
jgi:hypothetical protein